MKKLFTLATISLVALFWGGKAQAQCQSGESEITVIVVEDNYGSETEWKVTGPGGTPVYLSGGPYTDGNNGTSHTETGCIPVGVNAEFNITDDYGDGMCCSYGNGSYTVIMNECDEVATGGEFGSSETKDFTVKERQGVDLKVNSLDLDPVVVMGNITIQGEVSNLGTTAISTFELNYSIDNGATVSETINQTIAPCGTYSYSHSTPWNAANPGSYDVKVWISNVNGNGADGDTDNDDQMKTVSVATQSVPHLPLAEELTSSTCPPCASLNQNLDPLWANTLGANTTGGTIAAVKYQMDWPSPGTDPSYNANGESRRGFYGTTGIPDEYLDGAPIPSPTSPAAYNTAAAKSAFVDVDVSFSLNGNEVNVTATATPYANLSGDIRLYVAITEDYYEYTGGTTSQTKYYFAMRKMLPNGNGYTWSNVTAGTPFTKEGSYTFNLGNVTQNSYNLWASIDDITVVAWVQNAGTKEVYQAAFANAPTNVGIEDELASEINLKVFPNPFKDQATIIYDLKENENISVSIYNTMGQVVYTNDLGEQQAGRQSLTIDAESLSSGIYFMSLQVGDQRATKRISIAK